MNRIRDAFEISHAEFRAFYLLSRHRRVRAEKRHCGTWINAAALPYPGHDNSAASPSLQVQATLLLLALSVGPVAADQSDPGLDRLFDELQRTGSEAEVDRLTAEIWQRWVAHEDDAGRHGIACIGQLFSALIGARPDFAEALQARHHQVPSRR